MSAPAVVLALLSAALPARVASLNVCTDQFVLGLLDPARVAGVTFLARDPDLSVESARAAGIPGLSAEAESVLAVHPDLVLAGTYGATETLRLLERIGLRVERFAPVTSVAEARAQILRAGELFGEPGRAAVWAEALDRLPGREAHPSRWALAYGFGGSTAGIGTLEDELLERGGFGNLARRLGLRPLAAVSLEQLVLEHPDVLVLSTYRDGTPTLWRRTLGHPALSGARGRTVVRIPSAWTTCPTPRLADAVARLRSAAVASGGAR